MAKVTAPLFSLNATGKMGTLVYEKNGNINYVKSNIVSKKPPSISQLARRAKYGEGIEAWRGMSTEDKEIWNTYAKGKEASGFNYFMQFILTSLSVGTYGANVYNNCSY